MPWLKFGKEAPISLKEFICEAGKWLSRTDLTALISMGPENGESGEQGMEILRELGEFEGQLREELALFRKAKKEGTDHKIPDLVERIINESTPLLMEKRIEKMRWDFAEERSLKYNFDINWLILYHLKLQVIERLGTFSKDKGEEIFFELCEVKYE